jgi:HSP90 family molecular chaperone
LIDNLGTIASSGSKRFIEEIEKDTKVSGELAENIIG